MPPLLFNKTLVNLHKKRAALRIAQQSDDVLLSELADRLLSRLEDIRREFTQVEVVGSTLFNSHTHLICHSREGGNPSSLSRSSASMWPPAFAGVTNIKADTIPPPDLLISFLDLHWQNDPLSALGQAYERLAPEGLFMGVFWGGDTLHELRRVMVEVESQLTGGAGMRISPMITPYDTAALMQKAGFALPVVDMQSITLTYTHVQSLVEDLRTMGETAAFAAPANKPLTRIFWQEVETHYHRLYGLENGKIPATFTPIYMLGWRG